MKTNIVGSVENFVTIKQFTRVTLQKSIMQIFLFIIIILRYTTFYTLKEEASFPSEALVSVYRKICTHAPQGYVHSPF